MPKLRNPRRTAYLLAAAAAGVVALGLPAMVIVIGRQALPLVRQAAMLYPRWVWVIVAAWLALAGLVGWTSWTVERTCARIIVLARRAS